jgi:small subunit ribosomal protein S13e
MPYKRSKPQWLKYTSEEVEDKVCKLARKGMTPSQIGVVLRDSHGIGQVSSVTGRKVQRLLRKNGLAPDIPEDLYHLIKQAVNIRKHLEKTRKDKVAKYRLILTESKIHRIVRYYKSTKVLAPSFKYESASADTLVA